MQVRKQQLELDMEQQTGSKQEKANLPAAGAQQHNLASSLKPRFWKAGARWGSREGEVVCGFTHLEGGAHTCQLPCTLVRLFNKPGL